MMEKLQNIIDEIQDRLPLATVGIQYVNKTNDISRTALLIKENDKNVAPIIYIDEMLENLPEQEIIESVVSIYNTSKDVDLPIVEKVSDFNSIKDSITVQLINYESNKNYISDKVGRRFLDLYILAVIETNINGKQANIKVTKAIAKNWGIGEEEIIFTAIRNAINSKPEVIGMSDLLASLLNEDSEYYENIPMYVVRHAKGMYGAAKMLDTYAFDALTEKFDSDLIIIPSSIYELLILPDFKNSREFVDNMIHEVNSTVLDPTEILSNHSYIYSRESGWTY